MQIAQPGQRICHLQQKSVYIVPRSAKQGAGVGVELHHLTALMRPMVDLREPNSPTRATQCLSVTRHATGQNQGTTTVYELTLPFGAVTTNLIRSPAPQVFSSAVYCLGSKASPILVSAKVAVQVLVSLARITSTAIVASAGKGLPSRSASSAVTALALAETVWVRLDTGMVVL